MDRWAQAYGPACTFLCICVVGSPQAEQLAAAMGGEMKLKHCVNGFIDNRASLPGAGQLGCGGFIVFDQNAELVSPQTSAFMEVRHLAFQHVSTILSALLDNRPVPQVCPGEMAIVTGLTGEKSLGYNEAQGICISAPDPESGRVGVALLGKQLQGKQLQVLPKNLRKLLPGGKEEPPENLPAAQKSSGCSGGSCGTGACAAEAPSACGGGSCGIPARETSCANGSCGMPSQRPALKRVENVASVGVGSMDGEHEECVDVLNDLVAQRSRAALAAVHCTFQEHFAHEEALLREHGFGGDGGKFSALESHKREHKRILQMLRGPLAPGALPEEAGALPEDFVQQVMDEFVEHAEQYDSKYTAHLVAAGAA